MLKLECNGCEHRVECITLEETICEEEHRKAMEEYAEAQYEQQKEEEYYRMQQEEDEMREQNRRTRGW